LTVIQAGSIKAQDLSCWTQRAEDVTRIPENAGSFFPRRPQGARRWHRRRSDGQTSVGCRSVPVGIPSTTWPHQIRLYAALHGLTSQMPRSRQLHTAIGHLDRPFVD